MKPSFAALALLVMLTGCIPLRQVSLVEGPVHPSVMLYDRSLLSGFDLTREKIDANQSFLTSPAGKRYTLDIRPHQFDIEQKCDYVSALLFPIAEDGVPLGGWRSGVWSFHFVVETNGVTQTIDQKWKYDFFYYNPIIHGRPN